MKQQEWDHRPNMQTLYPKRHTNKCRAGPPSQHANPVAQMKTTWARVGAGPPSRHTNPVPQTPHEQGSSRTTVPTRKPCTPDATQTRVGAGPPSRHTNPAPQTPHGQGSEQDHRPDTQTLYPRRHTNKGRSRTTVPTHKPCCPDEELPRRRPQGKGGSRTTVPTHQPIP